MAFLKLIRCMWVLLLGSKAITQITNIKQPYMQESLVRWRPTNCKHITLFEVVVFLNLVKIFRKFAGKDDNLNSNGQPWSLWNKVGGCTCRTWCLARRDPSAQGTTSNHSGMISDANKCIPIHIYIYIHTFSEFETECHILGTCNVKIPLGILFCWFENLPCFIRATVSKPSFAIQHMWGFWKLLAKSQADCATLWHRYTCR